MEGQMELPGFDDYPTRTPEEWTEEDLISMAADLIINARVMWHQAPQWWLDASKEHYRGLINYLVKAGKR